MKLKIFVAMLLIAVAWVAGRHYYGAGRGSVASSSPVPSFSGDVAGPVEQKVDESYKLNPGARVIIKGINGPVEITTADVDTAELHVVNNVSDARFAENHKVTVQHSADELLVQASNKESFGGFGWLFGGGGSAKQRVTLRIPRRVELIARGIKGDLRVGELDGPIKVSGISGQFDAARVVGRADISGVNGPVSVGLAALSGEGTRVSGVSGPVELRLAPGVNADIRAGGINGPIDASGLAGAQVEKEAGREGRSGFVARLGTGGVTIKIGGINGPVTLKSN